VEGGAAAASSRRRDRSVDRRIDRREMNRTQYRGGRQERDGGCGSIAHWREWARGGRARGTSDALAKHVTAS
jgi:hypothetical protein